MSHVHIVILACNVVSVLPDNRMHLAAQRRYIIRSGLKTRKAVYHVHWVHASRHKFAKPQLAYALAMGGQTDSQVSSQVTKSRKIPRIYTNTCAQLVSTCIRIWARPKSTQVHASGRKSAQVENLRWLASPSGQGLTPNSLCCRQDFFPTLSL